jgi:hypothetical protein
MTLARYVTASFIAPLAALLLPGLFALSQLFADVDILPDGSADDAPVRGAGLFLVMGLPFCYIVGCLYYAAVGHILVRWRRFTLRATITLAAVTPWLLFVVATIGHLSNNLNNGLGLFMLAVISVLMSLFAVLGALVWWFIAIGKEPPNVSLQRTVPMEKFD